MSKNKEFQEIRDIGFKSLVKKIEQYKGTNRSEILQGIGDDAAVFQNTESTVNVVTSEIFLEGVHFDLTYHPLKHLGYKLVTAAVSDVYAMNAKPVQVLLNVALPNAYSVQMVEQLYEGIDAACLDYGVELSGGDTTASHQLLAVSVTATGESNKQSVVYRKGANHGDAVCITGDLGAALAGLRILMREKKEWQDNPKAYFQPDLEAYEYVVSRQLVPAARKDFVDLLYKNDIQPSSMIDVTQGLIPDLTSLAQASSLGMELFSPAIPISIETRNVADEMKEDVDKYAFYGGEDYEFLFTLNKDQVEELNKVFDDYAIIGKMTNEFSQIKMNTGEDNIVEFDV